MIINCDNETCVFCDYGECMCTSIDIDEYGICQTQSIENDDIEIEEQFQNIRDGWRC